MEQSAGAGEAGACAAPFTTASTLPHHAVVPSSPRWLPSPSRRRPHDEGFSQQPATLLAVWQRMLPLLHRLCVCWGGKQRGGLMQTRADSADAACLEAGGQASCASK